jgi:hypothetical protein
MAIWFRHRCAECDQPVVNKKGLEWKHVNGHADDDHSVPSVKVERMGEN